MIFEKAIYDPKLLIIDFSCLFSI